MLKPALSLFQDRHSLPAPALSVVSFSWCWIFEKGVGGMGGGI